MTDRNITTDDMTPDQIAAATYEDPHDTIQRLRQALTDVVNPVDYLRRYAQEQGRQLDGGVAYQLSQQVGFVQGIARKALEK